MTRLIIAVRACASLVALTMTVVACGTDAPETAPAGFPTTDVAAASETVDSETTTETADPSSAPVATTTATIPVNPAAYERDGYYFFISPTGKWQCGILASLPRSIAGCHGPIPTNAPLVQASADVGQLARPNAIYVTTELTPARFQHRGDPIFFPQSRDPSVLPYGHSLTVGSMTCVVEKATGVTCDDTITGHGFTVSSGAYALR